VELMDKSLLVFPNLNYWHIWLSIMQ
jgi:hypothetical protein